MGYITVLPARNTAGTVKEVLQRLKFWKPVEGIRVSGGPNLDTCNATVKVEDLPFVSIFEARVKLGQLPIAVSQVPVEKRLADRRKLHIS